MHPWGITTKPCIGSKKASKSDLTPASCSDRASIPSAPTRASKTFCATLAFPGEICVLYAVTETSGSTSATANIDRGFKVMKSSKAMALIFGIPTVRAGGLDTTKSLKALAAARGMNFRDLVAGKTRGRSFIPARQIVVRGIKNGLLLP
jgi:hypothetical protein